ncbi:phage terminase large subunit-like protein [Ruminiclostridium sufflavum DSM 19573]|uniref:Phage terminase large subunit-like protein n=1 Tax=Ruminiclostridium sufflavum DSM 19573 TaxID=1121337 RepID=A0A318XNK0_9FIRM|nr:terminase TerL endonuclease subunit [Ruminiclostridium sufflavum]PYG88491.1 phage terminase large subunit-like protein [Ruminiclostridium sufflavum DSM 19573]
MINCKEIKDYIDLVRSGKFEVCKEQLLLCDYVEQIFKSEKLYINKEQLEEYLALQKYFPFELLAWEKLCFTLHNCVYKEDGQLRWPVLFVLVGRGAGKNGYLAFEDFCLLTPVNGVKYYFIDIFAMSEDQAKTTFEDVYNVMEDNKTKLKNHFYWNKEEIINLKTKSRLKFRTSGVKTKDGGRPGKIDFDEYHAYESMKLVDTATTGLGKKPHPRRTIISTNGDVRGGPLDDLIAKSESILRMELPDNGTLPFICKLDNEDEIKDKKKWSKANPSLAFFPTLQHELDIEFGDYLQNPIGNSSFATKRMNMPQGDKDAEVTTWENILATNQSMPDLTGCTCVAGIDYAKTTDFVCAGLLFIYKGIYYWLSHTWVCKKCNDLGRIKAPLKEWEKMKLLTFVDGPEVSPDIPAAWLQEQGQKYNITILGMDNYRYTLLARSLRNVGFDVDKNEANNIMLARPSNEMLIAPIINSLFVNHNIAWGDNPLMRWYTNNTCMVTSQAGNITYGKIEPKSRKTDGFKAFVAAMCASGNLEDSGETVNFDFGVYTY